MTEFDPEFDSGCSSCDTEHPMSDMFYDPSTGEHTCVNCHSSNAFDYAMVILKVTTDDPTLSC